MISAERVQIITILVGLQLFLGCQSVDYIKSEMSGTAKPPGGIQEQIPVSKVYPVSDTRLRQAIIEILDEDNYFYAENSSTNTIRTEPKSITDQGEFRFAGAAYYSKMFIKLASSTVTFKVLFDKKSNVTMAEQNLEFPEKENELRKNFFSKLDQKLNFTPSYSPSANQQSYLITQLTKAEVQEIQRKLNDIGYSAGTADGIMGGKTRAAIESFQREQEINITGIPDNETINLLDKAHANAKNPIKKESSPTIATIQPVDTKTASNNKSSRYLRIIGNENVEIKSQPDLFSDVVTTISPGAKIEYTDKTDSWYNVKTNKGAGFIYEDFVKVEY